MRKMRVAIIGQGRSGWDIHGKYFASEQNTNIEVAYVVDALAVRREKAAEVFGCPVFADYTALYDKKDIDLVVNASFSQMHYPITKDLLEHGFNVLVEKPFGRTYYECADLMRVGYKLVAALGEGDRVVDSLKQQTAEFLFELLDLKGNRGLRISQHLRRLRKAAQLGNMDNSDQIPQLHIFPLTINIFDVNHPIYLFY